MNKTTRKIVRSAVIAALYFVLTHLQNMIFPDSASMAIQFRASEALCVLAFFTTDAIPGLSLGCFLFNLTSGAALPFDFLVGSLATFLAAVTMWQIRNLTVKGYPLAGMLMPALFNAVLVGAELTLTIGIGGSFWVNALCVAIGEGAVLLTLGTVLYYAISRRGLEKKIV